MARKEDIINESEIASSKDEVISVKFNVDAALIKDEATGIYYPLNLDEKKFKDKNGDHPLSLGQLYDREEGYKDWKLSMFFQSENMVHAGNIVKMKASDAQPYLKGFVQKNGHRVPNQFTTYHSDPNLYKGYPVAEKVEMEA